MNKDSDNKWFGKAIRAMLNVTGMHRQASKEEVRQYWDAVADYPKQQVRAGIGGITRIFTAHATPADLRNAVLEVRKEIAREQEYKDNRSTKPIDPRGLEYSKMKGAAAPMFLRRILKVLNPNVKDLRFAEEMPGEDDYTGSFDYGMIVNAVPIREGLDLHHTEEVWKQFFAALGYEWDQYAKNEGQS